MEFLYLQYNKLSCFVKTNTKKVYLYQEEFQKNTLLKFDNYILMLSAPSPLPPLNPKSHQIRWFTREI